ncbi:MAG: hypothetical protein KF836_11885 [Fimbriimonadaceae bacterium]|nr:hypothetical protein [Fimbriimonadaceae bacterium]
MKKSLITVFAVVVMAALVTGSFAQSAGPRGGTQGGQQGGGQRQGGMRMNPEVQKKVEAAKKKVLAELKLTADQTKKVAAADKKQADAMKKLRDEMVKAREAKKEINRQDMQAKFKKINDTHVAELKKAMGNDKYTKYESRMKEELKKIMEAEAKKNGGATGRTGGGAKAGGGKSGGN